MKRPFLSLIHEAGKAFGIQFFEIERNAVYRAEKNGKAFLMYNVDFGLNTTSAANIAASKSLTYSVLNKAGIPCVEHAFFLNPNSPYSTNDVQEEVEKFFQAYGPKIVVKPDNGLQGKDVNKVETLSQLHETMTQLFEKNLNVALSPYYEADVEFRVVILKGEAKLSFAKEKLCSWKHNLTGGYAKAKEMDGYSNDFVNELQNLAIQAAKALELNFCTVDILNTLEGIKVLEANSSVFLSEYMKTSEKAKQQAFQLYQDAFRAVFCE
jgi:glutathione synthase/RimK-type ligase-like ATP-grasp enzyme